MTLKPVGFIIAATAAIAGLLWNGELTPGFVSTAHAVIGRPLTPMSYAGVARRTTGRAVAASSAAAANTAAVAAASRPPVVVAPAPVVVVPGPTCVQVVNAYGQITYRC
jgi:hypothetical protein